MNRPRWIVAASILALAGGTVSWIVISEFGGTTPERTEVSAATILPISEEIARARLTGSLEALDRFIERQAERCRTQGGDAATWRGLAEAHLERCLLRDQHKGMAVGKPTHATLPESNRTDIDLGLRAIEKALELGDLDPDAPRIQSSLLSLKATGWGEVLALRPKIQAALRKAEGIDPSHPRVVIARACEKLFAPNRLFGHDPGAAERMFLRAAERLELDERPYVLAAMAAWLQKKTEQAINLLERALDRNPNNRYAREVLRRLRVAEAEPFARDV
jgi:tetratricopeptide (TPR) repeat protein